jgi:proline dehydrogenase
VITEEIVKLNKELKAIYPTRKSPFLLTCIDAEKYSLQKDGVYELQRNLFQKFNKINEPVQVVGTIQMYLKDSLEQIKYEHSLAKALNYRLGFKLVRGAYIHSEKDRGVIHDTKENTDADYNEGVAFVLKDISENKENSTAGHLIVASHNANSSNMVVDELARNNENSYLKSNVVLAQLLGMCDDLTYNLIEKRGVKNIIKYVPWGPPVETKDYLLRRLQENGDAVRSDNGWPLVKNVLNIYKKRFLESRS